MNVMSRDDALLLLHQWHCSPSLIRHCLTLEQVMRRAAQRYGEPEADPDEYALAGLLHDADWEISPDEHPQRIVNHLHGQGQLAVAQAISAHGRSFGVPAVAPMDKALFACDEITGFVVACSIIRPDGIWSLETPSVLKKLKNPKFAAGVDREEIYAGVNSLDVSLETHVDFVICALREKAPELGLTGQL